MPRASTDFQAVPNPNFPTASGESRVGCSAHSTTGRPPQAADAADRKSRLQTAKSLQDIMRLAAPASWRLCPRVRLGRCHARCHQPTAARPAEAARAPGSGRTPDLDLVAGRRAQPHPGDRRRADRVRGGLGHSVRPRPEQPLFRGRDGGRRPSRCARCASRSARARPEWCSRPASRRSRTHSKITTRRSTRRRISPPNP